MSVDCSCSITKNNINCKLGRISFPFFPSGFEITVCFILVNDSEVTESCNNGHSFPLLLFMHRHDYLEIVNDGRTIGKYCGNSAGQNILLTGHQILIKFHSDNVVKRGRFLIHFTPGPHGKYVS